MRLYLLRLAPFDAWWPFVASMWAGGSHQSRKFSEVKAYIKVIANLANHKKPKTFIRVRLMSINK